MPDGSGVLVDARSGTSFALNATAAEVWALCDSWRTAGEIAAALLERYETTPQQAEESVAALLAHLRELGVVE